MKQLQSLQELQGFRAALHKSGQTLAFVPTMGALHAGHMALVTEGLKQADICLPYIFVNPTQFAPGEDLDTYPRTLQSDMEQLAAAGAQAVYLPQVEDVYPDGPKTTIHIDGITDMLEGEIRPHFFDGVATVVHTMLSHAQPDIALFGEKDYQQLQVIKKMVSDFKMPINIIGVPTIRDKNGLALSSRNAYLSADDYAVAIQLNKILFTMADKVHAGEDMNEVEEWAKAALEKAGFTKVDYCTIRNAYTLEKPDNSTNLRILAAAHIGSTRLIDNIPI